MRILQLFPGGPKMTHLLFTLFNQTAQVRYSPYLQTCFFLFSFSLLLFKGTSPFFFCMLLLFFCARISSMRRVLLLLLCFFMLACNLFLSFFCFASQSLPTLLC